MKSIILLFLSLLSLVATLNTNGTVSDAEIKSLMPKIGVPPATNPNCQGDATSPVDPSIKIPCRCPPSDEVLTNQVIKDVRTGVIPQFPTQSGLQGDLFRLQFVLGSLQRLKCPAVSTRLKVNLDAIQAKINAGQK